MPIDIKRELVKVNGKLHELTTLKTEKGKILNHILKPLMVKFHAKDVFQIIIGASILAIPIGYTEETWRLGEILPLPNILAFIVLSLLFIAAFVYYNYFKHHSIKKHMGEFTKRTFLTYGLSFFVVAVLLGLIQKTPWVLDPLLAFKRVVIVTFPSSLIATIADMLR